ncbi:hypothetical protein FOZ63_033090 [Perkinsus olseni]|uniref:PNPLA domain-containing protein n=1 Tax=Perkinsus olseni TaxID=32597 RepID=A0A7J6T0E1_PEROL|nr:hypothetical protein FOZ63_033090 [Perkinsus olseni]
MSSSPISLSRSAHSEWAGWLKLVQLLASSEKCQRLSKQNLLSAAVVVCAGGLIALGVSRRRRARQKETSETVVDDRPTLALAGSGLRMGYMLGSVAALRDYVDISTLRVTAISGSAIGALLLCSPELDVVAVSLARKNCYMMDVSWFARMLVDELKACAGLTEETLHQRCHSQQLFFGITSFRPWPTPVCLKCPATFEEFRRVISAVICIPPFFTQMVALDNYPSADGFFSHLFAVPDDHDPTKVVRYCPFPAAWLDFRPPLRDLLSSLAECLYPFAPARQIASFKEGYLLTVRFLKSGCQESSLLKLKENPVNNLSEYVEGLLSLQSTV